MKRLRSVKHPWLLSQWAQLAKEELQEIDAEAAEAEAEAEAVEAEAETEAVEGEEKPKQPPFWVRRAFWKVRVLAFRGPPSCQNGKPPMQRVNGGE